MELTGCFRRWVTYFMVLVTMISFSSCSFYKEVEVLEIEGINVTQFDQEFMEAHITVKVKNPNWYALTLTQSDIDVFVNQKNMGKVQLMEKVKIPKKFEGSQTLVLRGAFEGSPGTFLDNLLSLLFAPLAEFQAKGYVKGKALLIGRKVPVEFTESVDLRQMNK